MPATHVPETVQEFIVVDMPAACTYYCLEIYRRSHCRVRSVTYDSTEIYRRSRAGYAAGYECTYDCTEIYRRSNCRVRSVTYDYRNLSEEEEDDEELGHKKLL